MCVHLSGVSGVDARSDEADVRSGATGGEAGVGVAAPRYGNGCAAGRPWRPREAHGKPLRNTVFRAGD